MSNVRLIDANALLKEFEKRQEQQVNEYCDCFLNDAQELSTEWWCVEDAVTAAPTIDAVSVVHSSWGYRAYRSDARITVSGEAVCRKCHAPFFRVRGHWFKYCPNCGAKMDAKEADHG